MTEEKKRFVPNWTLQLLCKNTNCLKSSLCWGDRLDTIKVVLLKHSILVMQDRAISASVKIIPNIEQDYWISIQHHKYIMEIMGVTSSHLLPLWHICKGNISAWLVDESTVSCIASQSNTFHLNSKGTAPAFRGHHRNWYEVKGQTKSASEDPNEGLYRENGIQCTLPHG